MDPATGSAFGRNTASIERFDFFININNIEVLFGDIVTTNSQTVLYTKIINQKQSFRINKTRKQERAREMDVKKVEIDKSYYKCLLRTLQINHLSVAIFCSPPNK